jgi:flagellar M-ring protein FliF
MNWEKIRQQIANYFGSLTFNQKATLGMTVILVVLGCTLLFRWATKPDYALLFSRLDLKEADQIVEGLKSANVPYKLTDGGGTIMVPSKNVYEWRMRLASQGLPSTGGIGFEIFDKKDIGISDFVQEVNYRRAIEGELSRTIMGIQGIQNVRVHIVIPKDRLFKENQQQPSASIVVTFKPNTRVSDNEIQGITHLVASSIEGLTPESVTVVDSKGKILASGWESQTPLGVTSAQLDLQRKVESMLESKAQSMLSTVLGDGNATVRISADLNFQRIERTDERYDPDNTAVLSEERNAESSADTLGRPFGSTEHSITNYQVPKTIERVTNNIGDIRRLTVAVLVDGVRVKATEGAQSAWTYQPRSADEMALLEGVVKNAVGFNPARGDQFEIRNVQFDQSAWVDTPANTGMDRAFWFSVAQKALPPVIILALLGILWSRLKKIKITAPAPAPGMRAFPTAATMAAAGPRPTPIEEIDVPKIDENVSPEAVESVKLLKQITTFVEEKPTMAARLLRYWMIEE